MKLQPESQAVLLKLANLQRAVDFGAEERQSPEQEELATAEREYARLVDSAGSAQMAVDDMENEILRIQADERKLRARERDDRKQLSAELEPDKRRDLEHDRYAAKSRIADLMSELQEAHNEIHALRNNRDSQGAQRDEAARKLEVARRAAEAAQAATANQPDPRVEIEQLRGQLPGEALRIFDDQRAENNVGAAEFKAQKSCGGCFIVLPPADQSAVRNAPADEVPQCPECGTYLIRQS
ncbi:zinc ribbon domain-containing protein [Corynebacterium sp. 32222D000AT]|uniref:zinc ribbon domain-containing protein n=1 Tax=unclassified Corynebacterium TaxID=2624378 RepID=UPI002AA04540|nr:C4-type zinc ribbon domain-containing protein [Mycobacteriaceae bacterium]MDY5830023.1 C4-type zinc ribbon domain-containing protein [Corynebacterium sp.]